MSSGRRGTFFMFEGPAVFEYRGYKMAISPGGASIMGEGWDMTLPHDKTPWDKLKNFAALTQQDLNEIADLVVDYHEEFMKNWNPGADK